jgi:MYXO-CTERM domain-containing protein
MVESQTVWEDPVDTGTGDTGSAGDNGGGDNGGSNDNGGAGDNAGTNDTGAAKAEVVHGASGCATAGEPARSGLLSAAALAVVGLASVRRRRSPSR